MIEWLGPADIATYRRTKEKLHRTDTTGWSDQERSHLAAMIRDCDYILEWLETGRRPGNKRGVERLAAYQREIPMEVMEKYAQPPKPVSLLSDLDFDKMEFILSMLTDRERQCYELHIGGMYSEREIADLLQLKRRTVREFLLRANKKVQMYKKRPVPLYLFDVV